MLSPTELEKFKEETHQACVLAGEKLLNWLVRSEKQSKGIHVSAAEWRESDQNCCCPLLARIRFSSLTNDVLSSDEFWSFASGFDDEDRLGFNEETFYLLGKEFRRKVLDGVYHPPR
jgi:hypothetical protein